MGALVDLIAPIGVAEFIDCYWGTRPLHIPGERVKFESLFGWRAFSDLLNTHYAHISHPDIRMYMDSVQIHKKEYSERTVHVVGERPREHLSPAKVQHLSRKGATTIVASVDEMDRRLQVFVNSLENEIVGARTNMNAYFSRDGRRAFAPHYDKSEAFIIQVEGQKEWTLYGSSHDYPAPRLASSGSEGRSGD